MFSEILSWRSLLRQPAPFNGRSTIAVHARHRMTAVSDSRITAKPPSPLRRRSSAPALYGHSRWTRAGAIPWARDRLAADRRREGGRLSETDRLFGDSVPAFYDRMSPRACITASMRASRCAKTSALAYRSRVGGSSRRGIFAVSPAVSAKGRQRIAHRRTALFPGAGNQTVPGEFFLRSFDGNARASGEAESPDPRRSQDPRDKHP